MDVFFNGNLLHWSQSWLTAFWWHRQSMNVPLELCIIRVTKGIIIITGSKGTTANAYPFIEYAFIALSRINGQQFATAFTYLQHNVDNINSTAQCVTIHHTTRGGWSQQNVVICLQNIFVTCECTHTIECRNWMGLLCYFINVCFGLIGCRATYSNMEHCSHFQRTNHWMFLKSYVNRLALRLICICTKSNKGFPQRRERQLWSSSLSSWKHITLIKHSLSHLQRCKHRLLFLINFESTNQCIVNDSHFRSNRINCVYIIDIFNLYCHLSASFVPHTILEKKKNDR